MLQTRPGPCPPAGPDILNRMRTWLGFGFAFALAGAPVFHQDVLPVLQKHCQECHRPGEAAPMPLLTYKDARPWAKSIKEAVLTKKMPPWFAAEGHAKFTNERKLTPAEVQTLVQWADSGAREGDPKKAPALRAFREGWNIQPDLILEMPVEYEVPSAGTVDYQYFIVPTGFTEDRWVQAIEVRPGNRAVLHHAAVFVRDPQSRWMRGAAAGAAIPAKDARGQGLFDELLDFHVPGSIPHALPPGQAKLLKAGSDLVFQMHYTANGKSGRDRSRIGLVFSKEPPKERVFSVIIANQQFRIPPGAADHPVEAKLTLQQDARLVALNPHMHLRGKSFEIAVRPPGGEAKTVLEVPRYDFYWQLQYYLAEPLALARGTQIECRGRFDNSSNNPRNPDAQKEVRWGDQSWEEMMVGTVEVAIPAAMNPMDLYRPRPAATK